MLSSAVIGLISPVQVFLVCFFFQGGGGVCVGRRLGPDVKSGFSAPSSLEDQCGI
jgi:hypothetical protein